MPLGEGGTAAGSTYVHELAHLLLFHAARELALLRRRQAVDVSTAYPKQTSLTYP